MTQATNTTKSLKNFISDRLGAMFECGRFAGTMQPGQQINLSCPPKNGKFHTYSERN